MSKYTVNFWGSHPNNSNDDCWDGDDFATLAEAKAAFAISDPDDISVTHVEIDGPGINQVRKIREPLPTRNDDSWRMEIAREAGMLHGCDAYNEILGY